MSRFLTWEEGRQNSGYKKMRLVESGNRFLPFDAYLLFYPQGTEIKEHSDPVAIGRHVRINIELRRAKKGGMFSCESPILILGRLKVFYSDLPHHVTKIEMGTRLLLSVGIITGHYRRAHTKEM